MWGPLIHWVHCVEQGHSSLSRPCIAGGKVLLAALPRQTGGGGGGAGVGGGVCGLNVQLD